MSDTTPDKTHKAGDKALRLTPGRIRLHRVAWKLGRPLMHLLMQ